MLCWPELLTACKNKGVAQTTGYHRKRLQRQSPDFGGNQAGLKVTVPELSKRSIPTSVQLSGIYESNQTTLLLEDPDQLSSVDGEPLRCEIREGVSEWILRRAGGQKGADAEVLQETNAV